MLRRVMILSFREIIKPTFDLKYCRKNVFANKPSICTQTTLTLRCYSQEKLDMNIVEFEQVKKATVDTNILIVDVREPDELKEYGKIPNSVNIPLGSVEQTLQMSDSEFERIYKRKKPSTSSEIIFYCMIGKRSAKAQEAAQKLGFKNVKNYLGSFQDWAEKHGDKA